jgi:hypothetical protein
MIENKWSIFRILMVVVTVLFLIARISNIIYLLELSNMPILGNLIFPFVIQLSFLAILIFVPNQYRFLAILPLLYFVAGLILPLIEFVRNPTGFTYPSIFIFQYISSRIISIVAYITYIILLLPNFKYKIKHAILAGSFVIPLIFLFFINLVMNMGYMFGQDLVQFILRNVFGNFILSTSFTIVFTLFILEHLNKEQTTY